MNGINQASNLVSGDEVLSHVSRHDLTRVALAFDNHDGEFLLRLAGITIVKHVRRYEGGWCEVNLAEYSKMFQLGIYSGYYVWGKEEFGWLTINRQHRTIGNSLRGLWLHMSDANQVGFDQIPALISTVHQALVGLGKPGPKDAGPRIPAV